MDGLIARAQFSEMVVWMNRGWRKAAAGRKCPECGGVIWFKVEQNGRLERHRCASCAWSKEYLV